MVERNPTVPGQVLQHLPGKLQPREAHLEAGDVCHRVPEGGEVDQGGQAGNLDDFELAS